MRSTTIRIVRRPGRAAGVILAAMLIAAGSINFASASATGTDGDVVLGGSIFTNQGPATTYLAINSNTNNTGLSVSANNSGTAVYASTPTGYGVWGSTSSSSLAGAYGVNQSSGPGVKGTSSSGDGIVGEGAGNGVLGRTANPGASGIYGENTGNGFGVAGRSTGTGGVGVLGEAAGSSGVGVRAIGGSAAIDVEGKALFSRSGVITISYPNARATILGVQLSADSLILATAQANVGVYVKSAVPRATLDGFDIVLSKAPGSGSNPKSVQVGWFVVN